MKKMVNSFIWNNVVFNWNGYFQFAPLKFWNLAIGPLLMENLLFKKKYLPGLIVIEPLNFCAIYKTVLGFQFNQFSS
jgi:hypothetical protein